MNFKNFILLLLLMIYSSFIRAQENHEAKNSVYTEVLGNAASLSLNCDRIVYRKKNIALSFCFGAGVVPANLIRNKLLNMPKLINLPIIYGIPISCNMIYGKKSSHFETGIGFTYLQGLYQQSNYLNEVKYYSRDIFAVIRLGYRFQKKEGGLFWKIGVTPFITIKNYIIKQDPSETSPPFISVSSFVPMGGIALGYTFKCKKK